MQNEQHIVAVLRFKVTAENFSHIAAVAGTALREGSSALPGFIEGILLTNEARSRILIHSEWISRHNWAEAQWDDQIARAVAEMFEDTASYDLEFYFPLLKVTPASQ